MSDKTPQTIREFVGQTLQWRQQSPLRREYELIANGIVVAVLRFRANTGNAAVIRTPDGTWELDTMGFTRPRIIVRLPNSTYTFATFRATGSGEGILECIGEQRFAWRRTNFLENAWTFFGSDNECLITLKPTLGTPRILASVEFHPPSKEASNTALLVALSWYSLTLMSEEIASDKDSK